jgi:hypothetical protein
MEVKGRGGYRSIRSSPQVSETPTQQAKILHLSSNKETPSDVSHASV